MKIRNLSAILISSMFLFSACAHKQFRFPQEAPHSEEAWVVVGSGDNSSLYYCKAFKSNEGDTYPLCQEAKFRSGESYRPYGSSVQPSSSNSQTKDDPSAEELRKASKRMKIQE